MLFLLATAAIAGESQFHNGGFESGLSGWRLWSRTPGALTSALENKNVHSGQTALLLEHPAEQDWSLEPSIRLEVQPGDLVELNCWVKVTGGGTATLCASTWDAEGKVVAWSAGEQTVSEGADWQHLQTRVVASGNVRQMQPRLIGHGPATVWVDDYAVVQRGNVHALRSREIPATLILSNAMLDVRFNTSDAACVVRDRRTSRAWTQKALANDCIVKSASTDIAGRLRCDLFHAGPPVLGRRKRWPTIAS